MEGLSKETVSYNRDGLPQMAAAITRTVNAHRGARRAQERVAEFYERRESPTGPEFDAAVVALEEAKKEVEEATSHEEATRLRLSEQYGGPL